MGEFIQALEKFLGEVGGYYFVNTDYRAYSVTPAVAGTSGELVTHLLGWLASREDVRRYAVDMDDGERVVTIHVGDYPNDTPVKIRIRG